MNRSQIFNRLLQAAPFAVLTQILIRSFVGEEFNDLFEANRESQYEDKVTFEALGLAVADIALGQCENPNQAYRAHKDNWPLRGVLSTTS